MPGRKLVLEQSVGGASIKQLNQQSCLVVKKLRRLIYNPRLEKISMYTPHSASTHTTVLDEAVSHYDLTFRSRKDLNRAAQMRSFGAPGWPFSSRSAMPPNYHDAYMPSPRPKYDRDSNRAKSYYPSPISPFQKDQSFAPDFPSPFASYRPASSYHHRSSPEYSTNARLSFPKALRSLKFALDAVLCRAEQLHKSFNLEMQYVPYADERTRAYLWMLKVDYNGWNAEDDPPAGRNDRFDPFARYSARLLGAIDDVQHSDPPSSHEWPERPQRQGGAGFDGLVEAEDVRLAMKKLDVSLEGMTELLKGVKADKRRCVVLIRELRSTVEILETIKVVWEVPGSGKGATARSGYQERSSTAASSPSGKTSDTEAEFRGFDDCGYGPPI